MTGTEVPPRALGRGSTVGVVLSGGGSRRMGIDKAALAHPDGGTWLDRARRTLRPWCRLVAVAGPWAPGGVPRLSDAPEGAGPLAGIAAAGRAFPAARHFLVLAVDLPLAEPGRLMMDARRSPDRAVVGRTERQVQPLAGLYPAAHVRRAAFLLARGEARVRPWLGSGPWRAVAGPDHPWHNANTTEQARALGAWEERR